MPHANQRRTHCGWNLSWIALKWVKVKSMSKTVSVSILHSVPAVDEKVFFSNLAILTLTWFLCSNNKRQTTMDLSYDQHDNNYYACWWWFKMPNGFYMQNPFKHFPFLDTSIRKFSDEHFSILGKLKLEVEIGSWKLKFMFVALSSCHYYYYYYFLCCCC